MNLSRRNSYHNGLLYAGFNQDQGCFACGMENGFRIYNTNPVKERERQDFDGGVAYVEMLFRCNYLALIGGGDKPMYPANQVVIWDDLKKAPVIQMDFNKDVRAVKLRRGRIVVLFDNSVRVYTFTEKPQQLTVFETSHNPKGLCASCPNSDNSLLVFPSRKFGNVEVVNLANTEVAPLVIHAHKTTLACLSLNPSGTLLATASEKGTLVRVFDTMSGAQLHELRRGANNADVYCINFNVDSTLLCLSSDHGTLHVFALQRPKDKKRPSLAASVGQVVKYFGSTFSTIKLQIPGGARCICAFGSDRNTIVAICADGSYYKYIFDQDGKCSRDTFSQYLEMTDDK
ncbi:hypothetical protein RvY_18909 [Ramazzottius varieornatus]|uniref:WD repeat domain phosphoinositide-interacting protein 3 n=1 Tax=Ramazzottius varieornatus TaxID=947166 RepID=A0A1D1W7K1_RAMVA|nr:hypothetical protein RvY_18909 [Ramazzottius varieornatus]